VVLQNLDVLNRTPNCVQQYFVVNEARAERVNGAVT
jgi:hypothetical protein